MQALTTPEEFTSRAVGMPWIRWRSDWQACDCFGIIVLWHREVLGVDLGDVPQTDLACGFDRATDWIECEAMVGATAWMAWRDGAPTHCGIVLTDSTLLHSEAREGGDGCVHVSRLTVVRRLYGDIRFYRRAPC